MNVPDNAPRFRNRAVAWMLLATGSVAMILGGCRPLLPTPTPRPPSATPPMTAKVALATPVTAIASLAVITPSTPTPTATFPPCGTPPAGWITYLVQPGDTLSQLAQWAGVSVDILARGNCLSSTDLRAGQRLYLPSPPTSESCERHPVGWVSHTVQIGETLSELADRVNITVSQAQEANCLPGTALQAGQIIYLPALPTPSPTPCVPAPGLGWQTYTVRPGDSLTSLAAIRNITAEALRRANCLSPGDTAVQAGQRLFLPPLAVPAAPIVPARPLPVGTTIPPGTPVVPSASPAPASTAAPCRWFSCPIQRGCPQQPSDRLWWAKRPHVRAL